MTDSERYRYKARIAELEETVRLKEKVIKAMIARMVITDDLIKANLKGEADGKS